MIVINKPLLVAVDKPRGWSSYDVIRRFKHITGIKRIGHGGTLDPLATGVLVVAIGRTATRELKDVVGKEKTYEAEVTLGGVSDTDDSEGVIQTIEVQTIPNRTAVREVLDGFVGEISQRPPVYSAVKVKGQAAYKRVRRGEKVTLKERKRLVQAIELGTYSYPLLKMTVTTGPGVYIRSLARDIGEKLGTGGYLTHLKRTRVGQYTLDKAMAIDEIAEWWYAQADRE